MKTELERAGVAVEMESIEYSLSRFSHGTIHYRYESNLGLALNLLDFLAKCEFEKVIA